MKNEHVYVFVYGTLMPGERANSLLDEAKLIGEDTVNGRLYNVNGSYPGFEIAEDGGLVFGFVYDLSGLAPADKIKVLSGLDAYEGYPDLYDKVLTKTGTGKDVLVYTYNYVGPRSEIIPSGNWRKR